MENNEKKVLLSLKDVVVKFNVRGRILTAIRNVSLDVYENESLAIVGESGSGKSVLTKTFAGMLDSNGFIPQGTIILSDDEISQTEVRLTGANSVIFNRVFSSLNKHSRLERGAKEYNAIRAKEDEIKRAKSLTEDEEAEFAARLKDLKDNAVDTNNYLMTLDKKADADEYVTTSAKLKDFNNRIEALEKEKAELVKRRVEDYKNHPERAAKDAKKLEELKAARAQKIATEDEPGNPEGLSDKVVERNRELAYETVLSIGRYPLKDRIRFLTKLDKAFKVAMCEGADLENPDVRNKLFEVAGFRVEYRSFDPGTELSLNENGTYRFAAPTENVEETGSYRFEDGVLTLTDKNGRKIVGKGNPIRLNYPINEDAQLAGTYVIPADSLAAPEAKELKSQAKTLHGYAIIDCAKVKYTADWQRIRGTRIATVFQDPMTSLNPIIPIGKQIMTVILKHQNCSREEARQRTIDIMGKVGIPDPESRFNDYPFEYSGGMRQRIVIAIALSCQPKILICDEPTTALDVTIQAQILELIKKLQKELGFTTVYITHDLGVVANVAERVAVLYAGQIVETGTVEEIFYDPKHPYTWALLSSLPQLSERGSDLFFIPGTPPSLYNKLVGDAFAPRNQYAMAIDLKEEAPMFQVSPTHFAKTWLLDPRAPKTDPPANIQNLHEKIKKTYVDFNE